MVEQFRLLFDTMLQGVVFQDAAGKIISMNPAAERILGKSPNEFVGSSSVGQERFCVHEDGSSFPGMNHPAMVALRTGEEIRDVIMGVYNPREKCYHWISITAIPLFQPGEDIPDQVYTIFDDITERKRAEEVLKESEAKFRSFVEQSTDGVSLVDEEGRLIEWNKGLEEITGLRREEVIGRYFWDIQRKLMTEERRKAVSLEIVKKTMIETLRTGQASFLNRTLEVDFLRADGEIRRNSQTAFPIRTERGYRIGAIVRDITEKRRAEEALKESEGKFRQIFNSTNDAIFVADLKGRFLETNEAACQQLGYTKEELFQLGPADITPPEIGANIPDKMKGTANKGHLIFETIHLSKDGSQIPIELSTRTISYQGMPAILGVARDITKRKRAEEELKRSNAELQQFAYVASHDLREPLRMISSYLDLLEKKYEGKVLDEKAEEYIDFAVDGAMRMRQLIDDILAYSRVETKGKEFTEVDMNEVLATVLNDLKKSIEETGASITHDHLPSVFGDRAQMILLLENLIGNSIKFRDVAAPQIHVSSESKGADWVFSLEDNGIGIPKEQRERIFQMFQCLHNKEEYEGTGIGLAIAKKIVERHGGRIWVESEEGKGSTFFFTIQKNRQ